jgi:hypothetical protein
MRFLLLSSIRRSAAAMLFVMLPLSLHAATVTTTTLTNQESFDFDTQTSGSLIGGDLYYLSQDCGVCNAADTNKFWANNFGQQGLQDIGPVSLLSISSIPAAGYDIFGVSAVVGDSYISLAGQGESGNYIFFQVTGETASSVTIDWVYGSTAPAAVPEPGSLGLLLVAFGGLPVMRKVTNFNRRG